MQELHYNFVFLFADSDYWEARLGKEIFNSKHSRAYLYGTGASKLKKKLFHIHWAYKLNHKIKMPFKFIWYRDICHQKFEENLPTVYVFMGGNNIRYADRLCNYIRKQNSKNKIMILHNDMIAKHCEYNYEEIRKMADIITTYDEEEAEKYGIEYFEETTYSKLIEDSEKPDFQYDVYFLGAAKDRLSKIMESYRILKSYGLKVKFIIPGTAIEDRVEAEDISYDYISYLENLQYILKSKIIFEIVQKNSKGITMRALEAIAYRRKFITDCQIDLTKFFNEGQLLQVSKIKDIKMEFTKASVDPNQFNIKCDLNPLKRLYFIQKHLEEKEHAIT